MTLGEFRELTATLGDSIGVLVRWNDDNCCHAAATLSATVESGCAETYALMLDADTGKDDADSRGDDDCEECQGSHHE